VFLIINFLFSAGLFLQQICNQLFVFAGFFLSTNLMSLCFLLLFCSCFALFYLLVFLCLGDWLNDFLFALICWVVFFYADYPQKKKKKTKKKIIAGFNMYATLTFVRESVKTRISKKTARPDWNESFDL